jgi:putative ABC transport system permease protein
MFQQVQYLNDKRLGFEKKNILVLRTHNFSSERVAQIIRFLRTELNPAFDLMSSSSKELGIGESGASIVIELDNGEWKLPEVIRVDENFFRFLQVGKEDNVNWQNFPVQPDQVLVNQALVDEFGFQEPLGKTLRIREKNYSIAGVVPAFHFEALYHRIKPAIFFIDPANADGSIFVKFAAGQSAPALEVLKEKWREIAADLPFDYYFLDEALAAQYVNEARWTKMLSMAASLAILITCIGLLGLAAFTTEQRTKEIGVRKVLGATVANIVSLLSKGLVKLVLLANLIAWPVAWLAMTLWLRNFAHRVDIAWWIFILTGGLVVGLALLTVSTQAIKAALANPVEALRYE